VVTGITNWRVIGMEETAIQFQNISKHFSGIYALKDVTFDVKKGEIHSLVGENGAGKSTLMNILTGTYQPDGGSMLLFGKEFNAKDPMEAMNQGISMIHQELSVVTNLTVAENIFLGRYLKNKVGLINYKKMKEETEKLLKRLNIEDVKPSDKVASLSISKRQMVEIAKAISVNARIIVMDEPTSSLTYSETQILLKTMSELSQQSIAILFISHRMDEVFSISDRITVLRDGRYIMTQKRSDTDVQQVVSNMVGRELGDIHYVPRDYKDDILLHVKNLSTNKLFDINFDLRKGEILGFAGLVGSGRTEVARAIVGLDKTESGIININNKEVKIKSPRDAIKNRIGFVTEDRKTLGLFLRMSVKYNISIGKIPLIGRIFIDRRMETDNTRKFIDKLDVRTAGLNLMIKNLSGGNQQKAILARWLLMNPVIMILDEPTRGVDVGSKAEIYNIIRELANSGVGVILISSELPEILRMSDRVIVMSNGTITAQLNRAEVFQENIMLHATKSIVRKNSSEK
jgi:ABC-type sugar transport system ATPase subunit